ncbi:MAG: folate-binding protein [Candidatus Accumulibacter sp.]|jgi:folate-binding protein YgfZ|nr:folate-binding protein [Accumulibacter sp.]
MNAGWQAYLGAQGARIHEDTVRDFGEPEGELIAARDATIVAPLTQFALIECAGGDAQTFLHNQLTSDVKHLAAEGAQYAAWCSPKGRMLASFVLFRRDAGYLALLSADLREFIQKRLQIYVLRSQVSLANRSADHQIIGVSGPRAAAALQNAGLPAPAAALSTASFADGSVIRLDDQRYIVVAASDAAVRLWPPLAAITAPAGAPAWQWLDVAAGIPWIAEATREAFVPQMAGFDRIGGVSFHKGCYPGQEVVARTHYLGKIKRHLYRTRAAGPIAAGLAVFSAETPEPPCGQIANAAAAPGGGYDALAVILEDAVGKGELRAALPDGGSIGLTDPVPVNHG